MEEAGWGKREGFGTTAWDRGGKRCRPATRPAERLRGEAAGGAAGRCGTEDGDGRGSDRSGCSRLRVRDLATPPPPFAVVGLLRRKAGRGGGERMEEGHGEEGWEGGGRESEREEPGERDEADLGTREEERLLQEGQAGRGNDVASEGPGGERKYRDCSQASDLLKDVERGQRLCPGPGDKAALGAEREGAGAGPPGWCNSRGENGLCPTFLMPGGRAARL